MTVVHRNSRLIFRPGYSVLLVFIIPCTMALGCVDNTVDSPLGGEFAALPNQTNPVFALAFSADGKLLATAGAPWDEDPKVPGRFSARGQLYIWDLKSKAKIVARSTVESKGAIPQYPFMTVGFSPDGKTLVAGGTENMQIPGSIETWGWYYLYDVADGIQSSIRGSVYAPKENEYYRKQREQRQINRVWQLSLAPDGKGLAHTSDKQTVVIEENYREFFQPRRKGPAGIASCLSFAPEGKLIATGGGPDKLIRLWDVTPGKDISELASFKHEVIVSWVAFTLDGKTLAATDDSGVLKLWDVAQRKERHVIKAHEGDIGALAVSKDGTAATGGGNTIKLWDVKTGKELKSLPNQKGRIQALAFSPDSKILASSACDVGKEGEVRLWDLTKLLEANAGKQ